MSTNAERPQSRSSRSPIPVPLLEPDAVRLLPVRAQEVVEYRKSGLSLNHDTRHPHRPGRHGRAKIGWTEGQNQ